MEWTCRNDKYFHKGWAVKPTPEGWIILRKAYKELGLFERASEKTYTNSALAMFAAEKMMKEAEEWELV